MQIPVFRALHRMADRAKLAKAREEEDSYKHRAQKVHQRISFLESSRPDIVGAIDRLKRRRAELAKEMDQVTYMLKRKVSKISHPSSPI